MLGLRLFSVFWCWQNEHSSVLFHNLTATLPRQPQNFTVLKYTTHTVYLAWRQPKATSTAIESYSVIYHPKNQTDLTQWKTVNTPVNALVQCHKSCCESSYCVYTVKPVWSCTGWNLTFQSTEWWLNGNWMVMGKVDFIHHSVNCMAGIFQWPFIQWPFLKNKIMPNTARTRDIRIM